MLILVIVSYLNYIIFILQNLYQNIFKLHYNPLPILLQILTPHEITILMIAKLT